MGGSVIISMMRERGIPVLREVIEQKNNYEKHLLKLQRIQAERRQNLTRKTLCEKTVLIEHIRNQRHVDFMAKLTRQEARIDHENSRIADKLNRTAGSLRERSRDSLARSSLTCGLRQSRDKEISRENSRMFRKLVASGPSLSVKKQTQEYARAQQIAQRLRKYDPACELKVRKTMQATSNRKILSEPRIQSKPRLASFYDKRDILRNRIESRPLPPPRTVLQALEQRRGEKPREKTLSFFTQPQQR